MRHASRGPSPRPAAPPPKTTGPSLAALFTERPDPKTMARHILSPETPPAPIFVSACTCFRLRKLSRMLSQRYDAALAPAGINVNQLSILRRADHAPHTIGALAAGLGMDRTTLTRDLKHLIDARWIRLAPGDDARQKRIVVTAMGKRTVERALPLWRKVQGEVDGLLGHPALARLHADLDTAMQRLERTA